MSRKVKAAAIQMRCSNNVGDNIKKADEMTREAVKKGANIILLPELFERQYFFLFLVPAVQKQCIRRFHEGLSRPDLKSRYHKS